MSAPEIIGVRHHSPACARLVAQRIRALRPAFVLIEGPADFNARLDELALPHQLPVAIYSYLSTGEVHHGSWSPFAEHSPEWQALVVGRETGAQLRFIDLPAWHKALGQLENRYADVADAEHEHQAEAYEQALEQQLSVQGRDALWDHLFEDALENDGEGKELAQRLSTYFAHLRPAHAPGSQGNQQREQMMARWIAWAMAQGAGPVLVVCGGYHAPALGRLWTEVSAELPETPLPDSTTESGAISADGASDAPRFGSFLVPYTFKRLDAFAGYAAGMPSPTWYQWLWEHGSEGAARRALQAVLGRMRDKKLPASTADLMAVHGKALGLARLRGHAQPLRCDWLDALAGALVKNALDAPLPWSYRGPLRPGTDPVLVLAMDVLAGDATGRLAPGTPQPPLVTAVAAELEALGIPQRGTLQLDLLSEGDRAKSRLLHRLQILELPGIRRSQGPELALSAERGEQWELRPVLEQQAALIEAGAWGATLQDAACAKLEDQLRRAQGRIEPLAQGLNRAAWAGLAALSDRLLHELQTAVANEGRFEALAPALGLLHVLLRHGQVLGMAGAPVLRVVVQAGFDRALWLLEPAAVIPPAEMEAHLQGHKALLQIVSDKLAAQPGDGQALDIEPLRALGLWQRKAADPAAAPLSRGAALGAAFSLSGRVPETQGASLEQAMALLQQLPPATLGDALAGLLALAREALASEPGFAAGLDGLVRALDGADFALALPALRAAFAWLPPRERAALAEQVLQLHQATHLPQRVLTGPLQTTLSPEETAQATAWETKAAQRIARWGIDTGIAHGL
ncbi:DUF5682 family protein [Comamonas composti]|uniref:DUF5682 family protein n=1 Tax=Comamonas composti TaxID=408558 RepID=UPI00040417E6|nr:DUF5682 family protein [Comamonas composti]